MIAKAMYRNGLVLGLFAAFCAAMIAITYALTKDKIADNERRVQMKLLTEILPAEIYDNDLLEFQIAVQPHELLGTLSDKPAYIAKKAGLPTAIIFNVIAPDGYSGRIHLLVGISIDGKVLGVRTVKHSETPGLGDKIDLRKNAWILSFNDTSLISPNERGWKVKKDGGIFDQFSGATITPRATVKAVHQALLYYAAHKNVIFPNPLGETHEQY